MFGPPREPDPEIEGAIHGVRSWMVMEKRRKGLGLYGYGDYLWAKGGQPTRANCSRIGPAFLPPKHWPLGRPPVGKCHCGLYAHHPWARNLELEYRELSAPPGFTFMPAFGVVEAWGELELHEDGFRAEFAKPVVLFAARSAPEDELEIQAEVARQYECDLVVIDSAEHLEMEMMLIDKGMSREVVGQLTRDLYAPPRKPTWEEPWDRPRIVLSHVRDAGNTIAEGGLLLGTWIVKGTFYLLMAYFFIALYGGFLAVCALIAYEIIKAVFF